MSFQFSFVEYLRAKAGVDDRSLHPRILQNFLAALPRSEPRLLELGAGIGTMARRLHPSLPGPLRYELLDSQKENLEASKLLLSGLKDWNVDRTQEDLWAFLKRPGIEGQYDAVIAHAFLDLFDLETLLPSLARLGKPGALAWFTLNFDGLTAWEPEIDADFDRLVVETYHKTMDERLIGGRLSGDSRSGRHLFTLLPQFGFELLDAASSDWAVWPRGGGYQSGEAIFLLSILHFFEESLSGRPELDPARLKAWMAERRSQVERREAVFLAHQWDFLARFPVLEQRS